MKTLKEIHYDHQLNLNGKTRLRTAVRAIISNSTRDVLLIYSSRNGDYKFPGGGLEKDEQLHQALRREVKEECGYSQLEILREFGKVIEYRKPFEKVFDVFKMISYYYICRIPDGLVADELSLDEYEFELGFIPVWVSLQKAIETNHHILQKDPVQIPRWTRRDTFVLELLNQSLF